MSEKLFSLEEIHMGGTWILSAYPQALYTKEDLKNIFTEAFGVVRDIENELTDFRDSPFQKINSEAGKNPVKVSARIFTLIEKSLLYHEKSFGLFDISFASVGELFKEAKKTNRLPSNAELVEAKNFIDAKKIVLNQQDSNIFLPHAKMKISLGGMGKGYAVDEVFEFLKSKGIENFLVNGSGDLRLHSHEKAPRAWKIGIRNPFNPDPQVMMSFLQLSNGAVATSGDYINVVKKENEKFHHLINPETGTSSLGLSSVTVIADTALEADVEASIGMLLGPHRALEYFNQHQLYALLVNNDGTVQLSQKAFKGLERYTKEFTHEKTTALSATQPPQ
jgi:FAD:protein FMN transferase